jgi:hypothetical protein
MTCSGTSPAHEHRRLRDVKSTLENTTVTTPSSIFPKHHGSVEVDRRRPVGLVEQHLQLRRFKPLRRQLKLASCSYV